MCDDTKLCRMAEKEGSPTVEIKMPYTFRRVLRNCHISVTFYYAHGDTEGIFLSYDFRSIRGLFTCVKPWYARKLGVFFSYVYKGKTEVKFREE